MQLNVDRFKEVMEGYILKEVVLMGYYSKDQYGIGNEKGYYFSGVLQLFGLGCVQLKFQYNNIRVVIVVYQ